MKKFAAPTDAHNARRRTGLSISCCRLQSSRGADFSGYAAESFRGPERHPTSCPSVDSPDRVTTGRVAGLAGRFSSWSSRSGWLAGSICVLCGKELCSRPASSWRDVGALERYGAGDRHPALSQLLVIVRSRGRGTREHEQRCQDDEAQAPGARESAHYEHARRPFVAVGCQSRSTSPSFRAKPEARLRTAGFSLVWPAGRVQVRCLTRP